MSKKLTDYVDAFGIICTKPDATTFDGGDSLANTMTRAYVLAHKKNTALVSSCALFRNELGQYRRHPDAHKWYSNPNTTSRDQLTPLLLALAVSKEHKPEFSQILRQLASRGFLFAFNTKRNFQYPTEAEHLQKSTPDVAWDYKSKLPDVLGPDIWAALARGGIRHSNSVLSKLCKSILFSGIILLGDLQNLGAAIYAQYQFRFKAKHGTGRNGIDHDDRNLALKLHFAANYIPSPVSKLASLIYGKKRPKACFASFWGDRTEEPPIDIYMNMLYDISNENPWRAM